MTDQRWWAPTEPGIGPDEFDRTLLEVGGDAPRDLAQAFLALHRVGAAACEAVATQPLADESTLAFALANARKLVVPEATEIVSKSVGDNPNYGNLLLRDLLDDAEATSLSLWRSCIAKSVPTQMAAQRVGMVYGIPPGQLFTFQKLATDPRAQPIALQEAADRALFTFADQLVKEEAVEHKVEVSKQRPRRGQAAAAFTPDDPETDYYDARDASGEFAATEAPVVPPALPTGRPERVRKVPRVQRAKRARRVQSRAPQQMAAPGGALAGQQMVGGRLTGSALLAAQMSGRSVLDEVAPPKPVSTNVRSERDPGDVMAGYPNESTEGSQTIPFKLAYTMSTDEFQAFVAKARSQAGGGRPRFKAGRLEEYAGGRPEVFADWDAWEDEKELAAEHQRTVEHVAEAIRDQFGDQPAKVTKAIDRSVIEHADNPMTALDDEKMSFLTKEVGLSESAAAAELKHVDQGINFHNPEQEVILVYSPPPADRTKPNERPKVEITEAIVLDDNSVGFDEAPHGGKPDWRLVKDQTMTFTVLGDASVPYARRFWDDKLQAFRNYRYIRADDEVDKALSPERFHQLEEQGYIQRDDEGRFAESEEEAPLVAVPTRRRPQRVQRARRVKRSQRAPRQMASQQMTSQQLVSQQRAAGEMTSQQLKVLKLGLQGKREEDDDDLEDFGVLTLPDDASYLVPEVPDEDDIQLPNTMISPKGMNLSNRLRGYLKYQGWHSGLGAEQEAILQHQSRQYSWNPLDNEVHVASYENIMPEDLERIAYEIHERMQHDPNFTVAISKMKVRPDGSMDLHFNRNRFSLGVRTVIRVPHGEKIDLPSRLTPTWVGQFQSPRMMRSTLLAQYNSTFLYSAHTGREAEDNTWITNPHVQVWELENRNKR